MSDDAIRVLRVQGAPIDWALPAARVRRVADADLRDDAIDLATQLGIEPLAITPHRVLLVAREGERDHAIEVRGAIDVLSLSASELLEVPAALFAREADRGALRIAFPEDGAPLLVVDVDVWLEPARDLSTGSTQARGAQACAARSPDTS